MKYTTWLKTASVFQFITGFTHAIGLFIHPVGSNATEQQLIDLMDNTKFDMGAGMHRSMSDLFTALSSSFSLVCLLGGLMNWYLMRQSLSPQVMRGVININLIIFTTCFLIMSYFTFLPPIILTGLIFLFLLIARLRIAGEKSV